MATLTVRDAARRLGVKPRKARLMISERGSLAGEGAAVYDRDRKGPD